MDFYGMTSDELRAWATSIGLPAFRGTQIHQGLYHPQCSGFAEMKGIPKDLAARLTTEFPLRAPSEHTRQESRDGTVKKLSACRFPPATATPFASRHKSVAPSAAHFARRV
jgi:adenine C2-methylase RlmN of 23S rRNA A2503 and tRNA A37